jgi:hypothetical protein
MKKIFSIKIGNSLISILAILLVGTSYFLLGDRSFYIVKSPVIIFLATAFILGYVTYRIRNIIDYFINPLTIAIGVTDSLRAERLPLWDRTTVAPGKPSIIWKECIVKLHEVLEW